MLKLERDFQKQASVLRRKTEEVSYFPESFTTFEVICNCSFVVVYPIVLLR